VGRDWPGGSIIATNILNFYQRRTILFVAKKNFNKKIPLKIKIE
jgi:hypothetical protein